MARLHDMEVDEYLRKSVTVEPLALQEEYVQVPSDLAYWGGRYADALREHLRAKLVAEKTEARLTMECREQLGQHGTKVTESMVNAAVLQHPDYEATKMLAIEAEVEKVRLGGVVSAISTKREMLISLGAHVRKEMESDPSIRELHRTASAVRSSG